MVGAHSAPGLARHGLGTARAGARKHNGGVPMSRSKQRSAAAILSCLAGLLAFAGSAQAALTSPIPGSVQRGDVLITDPAGATVSGSFGGLCQATYRVR